MWHHDIVRKIDFFHFFQKKNLSERRCYSEIPGSPEEHVISTNRSENSQSVGTGQLTGHLKIILRHDTWHWRERPWKTQNSRLLLFFCSTGKMHIGAGGKPQFNANRSVMTSWHPVLECHFFCICLGKDIEVKTLRRFEEVHVHLVRKKISDLALRDKQELHSCCTASFSYTLCLDDMSLISQFFSVFCKCYCWDNDISRCRGHLLFIWMFFAKHYISLSPNMTSQVSQVVFTYLFITNSLVLH